MDSELRNCNKCGHPKDPRDFGHKGRVCSSCRREYHSNYYIKNKPDLNDQNKANVQELNAKVFDILGKSCVVCDETELEFLTVDHLNNDRKQERDYMSHVWKRDLIAGKVEISKYQVLCRNCNEAKQRLNPVTLMKERIPTGIFKKCSLCVLEKDTSEFSTSSVRGKKCLDSSCALCARFSLLVLTIKCYSLLGGYCVCCNTNEPCKLNIDHVYNDGAERRRDGEPTGANLCRQILNGKRDMSDYQLLCANCNYSKLIHGMCIHLMKVAA
jgi:hypothetical protein